MQGLLALLVSAVLTAFVSVANAQSVDSINRGSDKNMWVFFDLGDTVISAKDMKHLQYFPGVREYMHELHRSGIKIGMITNIPETWGLDYSQKLISLKNAISAGWAEPLPFEWETFDQIILPMKDVERKPAATLFLQAIESAQHCPSAYIGESPNEIAAADHAGMATKLFVNADAELYVRPAKVREFLVKNYKLSYDSNCLQRVRSPRAIGANIRGEQY